MCLLVMAWQVHPRFSLVVAANRDEFHQRPTAPMAGWSPPPDFLAGRDLRAGGTWLGLDRRRRFGVITNFRDLQPARPAAPSRGQLIPEYLRGALGAGDFLQQLEPHCAAYAGFNLLLADGESLWYASNRAGAAGAGRARALGPGIYGLSNQFLDTPWPKLRRVRQRFEAWLAHSSAADETELFDMLNDRTTVEIDADLPRTGLSPEWERVLSSPFVVNSQYGTRSSTILLLEPSGAFTICERSFNPQGGLDGEARWEMNSNEWL